MTVSNLARVIEIALRNVLGQGGDSRQKNPPKRSPRRKKVEDNEVNLEKASESSKERDFILVCSWSELKRSPIDVAMTRISERSSSPL